MNPEECNFADVDGDGKLDIIGAQGWSANFFFDGSQPGVRVIWGGGTTAPTQWSDGGVIPATANQGHFHYVRSLDMNGDGRMDIVAGGRMQEGGEGEGKYAGIIWLEAPSKDSAPGSTSQSLPMESPLHSSRSVHRLWL